MDLWDYVLSEEEVLDIGTCKVRGEGNVIKWERDLFEFYNVAEDNIEDAKNFCIPEEKMFVFPEIYSLPSAIAL